MSSYTRSIRRLPRNLRQIPLQNGPKRKGMEKRRWLSFHIEESPPWKKETSQICAREIHDQILRNEGVLLQYRGSSAVGMPQNKHFDNSRWPTSRHVRQTGSVHFFLIVSGAVALPRGGGAPQIRVLTVGSHDTKLKTIVWLLLLIYAAYGRTAHMSRITGGVKMPMKECCLEK